MESNRTHFCAGELIFAEGDAATTAFLIDSGQVRISTSRLGALTILGELGPGALLGEMAVIDDAPRSAEARALTDCVFTPIDRRQFGERIAAADPVLRALLLNQLERHRSTLVTLGGGSGEPLLARNETDDRPALAKIRLESELRGALERGELDVHLQPVVELGVEPGSETIAGYEALTRWHHGERGVISPAEFIGLAEETSLIVPIGEFVLTRVCEVLAKFARRGVALPFIALNVSARQLRDPDLVARMLDKLTAHGVPASALKVEVTESLVIDQARVGALIARCHRAGMQVALDDFGTGWSNLGPLLGLGFDQMKLDRQFVGAMDTSRGKAVVAAIAALARALGCDLIAEGVETTAQRDALVALGCRYAQGWLFGRPLAIEDALREA